MAIGKIMLDHLDMFAKKLTFSAMDPLETIKCNSTFNLSLQTPGGNRLFEIDDNALITKWTRFPGKNLHFSAERKRVR